ncbi:hypothetical protein BDZ45DRAFT_3165 [Acephala macrosclerotiorum]|nr:hypothetical protein BDZ45DRAFT_3165 [Acephala macrosclerotiorum]
MDINAMDQGLLKRNPSLTSEQFYHHWLYNHAPLVVPFFLHSGVKHYEQIHGPLIFSKDPVTLSVDISTFDGAAVILPDERRFLFSEALDHIMRVPPQTVKGERKVVIDAGKSLIEVKEGVWKVWREYEAREKEEEERKEVNWS